MLMPIDMSIKFESKNKTLLSAHLAVTGKVRCKSFKGRKNNHLFQRYK